MKFTHWLSDQWDWLKGFLSEGTYISNGQPHLKASSKRLGLLVIIFTFVFSYIRLSWDSKVLLDVPAQWALLIPIILGLQVASNWVSKLGSSNGGGESGNGTSKA